MLLLLLLAMYGIGKSRAHRFVVCVCVSWHFMLRSNYNRVLSLDCTFYFTSPERIQPMALRICMRIASDTNGNFCPRDNPQMRLRLENMRFDLHSSKCYIAFEHSSWGYSDVGVKATSNYPFSRATSGEITV